MMTVLSVNVGSVRAMADAKVNGTTGIYKVPVAGDVMVHMLGLEGDAVCDTENHGGPGQAVYVYGTPDYEWWSAELGAPLEPGMFGENLTVSGLASADCNIGDQLLVGDVLLEISAPRIPCHVLAKRMDDAQFVKRFRAAERPGLYCRVITPGVVRAGMPVGFQPLSGPTLGVIEMFRDFYTPVWSAETRARHLAAPIAERARGDIDRKR